ncbi:hypothetical protein C1645_831356 [Glomus cerebriforme]|uniref:Uncharacterized protein n=1 Tax=Glomus cerebriforme TaxID=658196 RepID=A0A397SLU1_9GLOM|nr:hypothetical protein C1645_831356 [Glomus cerebriforme]
MNRQKWTAYTSHTESSSKTLLNLPLRLPKNQDQISTFINRLWSDLKFIINNAKKDHIPKFTRQNKGHTYLPLNIRQLNNNISLLTTIAQRFQTKYIKHYMKNEDNHTTTPEIWTHYWLNWKQYRVDIYKICNKHQIPTTLLPTTITPHNLNKIKDYIKSLISITQNLKLHLTEAHNIQQINKFINIRNEDLKHNQRKMINSILNRKPKRIVLDRLVITNDDDTQELTLDPDTIESHVINHFQNIGSNPASRHQQYTTLTDLPPEWQTLYAPKESIRQEWFSNVTDPITMDELQSTISQLPRKKSRRSLKHHI